jgi:hypothetical protein
LSSTIRMVIFISRWGSQYSIRSAMIESKRALPGEE